jgi:hypothetical protein
MLCLPWLRTAFAEEDLNFLDCLSARLRVSEIGLHSSAETEHAENYECPAGYVDESWRDKEPDGEVEKPTVIPTHTPLRIRPAINCLKFLQEASIAVPMSHQKQAKKVASRRPNLFEKGPAIKNQQLI